jgi:hypothetical protein
MLQNKDGDMFYMKECIKCCKFFFVTAKHAKICEDCLTSNYKKFFGKRNIKYISYDKKKELILPKRRIYKKDAFT